MKFEFDGKTIIQIRRTIERIREEYKNKNKIDYAVYVLKCEPIYTDREKMVDWLENIEYGVISEELLKKQAEQFAEREDRDVEIVEKNMEKSDYTYPDYFDVAFDADDVYYVGQTENLTKRIKQHLGGNGSQFTSIFVPVSLVQVEWHNDRERAKSRERELAEELSTYTASDYRSASHKVNSYSEQVSLDNDEKSGYTYAYFR